MDLLLADGHSQFAPRKPLVATLTNASSCSVYHFECTAGGLRAADLR